MHALLALFSFPHRTLLFIIYVRRSPLVRKTLREMQVLMDLCHHLRASSPAVQIRAENYSCLLIFSLISLVYLLIDPAAAVDDETEAASFSIFRNKTSEMPLSDRRRRLDSAR